MTRRRSALYLPASNPRAIEKARGLACDAVILDLEDAVAPDRKADARDAAVAAGGFGDRTWVIRANALDTEWGRDDLIALEASDADAILLPKVSRVDDLRAARAVAGTKPLWAMIETCEGVLRLPELSAAAGEFGLTAMIAGTNDLAKEMRCRPGDDRMPLIPALTQIVTAARAADIVALDGVMNALDDADRLAAECAQGAMLGFDGKTLIHPAQIDAANGAFGPSASEIDWARRVVVAFADPDAAAKGAIRLDGAMVERLHLEAAERILADAG